ncbi:MAG: DUF1003 domain-containing protein [Parvibaculum sp.]|nr:DUF1003 domain-containing protein [Parvibaculum sp.]|tara:strand:+ start:2646 stop:3146 length:501 start_codon:yes stop_codon:yes gene_type:complete
MVKLTDDEFALLQKLRKTRAERRRKKRADAPADRSFGLRVSDAMATGIGSWTFILIQSGLLVLWMIANVAMWVNHWDPYPFILLNLALSFQAAFTAPIIMMSQNRQAERDRADQQHDFDINIKAELEIEALHQKLDVLREVEILKLTSLIENLCSRLDVNEAPRTS